MNNFFENLSFKQKIIFGFSLLSAIFLLGMGFMLFEFTDVSTLSANIIEKHQPITRSASNALDSSKSAANHLHKYLLNGEKAELLKYYNSINEIKKDLKTFSEYSGKLDLKQNDIERANIIVTELNKAAKEIEKYSTNYELNHPVINIAATVLNPLAFDYLAMLNRIISENEYSNLPRKILIQLFDMRHTWVQMISALRITLATKQAREFVNVKTYAEINLTQMQRLKKMKLDLGIENINDLEKARQKYIFNLNNFIASFDKNIWRMDANIMTNQVMPLFVQLDSYFQKLANIQLEQSGKADKLLAEQIQVAQYTYVTLIILGLIVAFIISSFITHSLRRPLKQLVSATKEVAKGNLQQEININGSDEIAYLSRAFNEMVNNLYISQQALMTARDVAEHANTAKSQFLTRMSHELRTPLNAILGFAQLLEMTTVRQPDSAEYEYVENILTSGWHLLGLVEEVLDLSQIETNTALIHKESTDAFPLLNECIEIIRPTVNDHHLTLETELSSAETCYIDVDPIRFKQIINNLLTNAVKNTRRNGKIKITSECIAKDLLIISVYDEGDGLTEEQISTAFEAFQHFSVDDSGNVGTGIGLNITRNLVELMDGEIGVKSVKGEGSCFWVEFPLNKKLNKESLVEQESNKTQCSEEIQCTILYVEDDIYNLELVREILAVLHPEIVLLEADTAEEGLKIAAKEKPQLILMDLNLPGMSGLEALERLRQNEETMNIPVIAISADAVKETIKQGRKKGFIDYITKPLNVNEFLSVVETIIINNK